MATSLLDWIIDLMRDGSAREAFNTNPQTAMASAGFTNVCGEDVRPFLIDNPAIREVAGASLPQGEPDITYVVNNYTIEAPTTNGNNVIDEPTVDGPDIDNAGDGNTNTASEENTTTQEDNDTTNDASVDSSSDDDTSSEADNIVPGDGSAGDDQIQDSTITDIGEGVTGDDNTNVLVLTDNLNNLDVLSNLVDDTLNGSPILNNSPILNDVLTDSFDSVHDLVNVLG